MCQILWTTQTRNGNACNVAMCWICSMHKCPYQIHLSVSLKTTHQSSHCLILLIILQIGMIQIQQLMICAFNRQEINRGVVEAFGWYDVCSWLHLRVMKCGNVSLHSYTASVQHWNISQTSTHGTNDKGLPLLSRYPDVCIKKCLPTHSLWACPYHMDFEQWAMDLFW